MEQEQEDQVLVRKIHKMIIMEGVLFRKLQVHDLNKNVEERKKVFHLGKSTFD